MLSHGKISICGGIFSNIFFEGTSSFLVVLSHLFVSQQRPVFSEVEQLQEALARREPWQKMIHNVVSVGENGSHGNHCN